MEIVQRIGGLNLRAGFMLRKTVAMKKQQRINQIQKQFANGAKEKQIDAEVANSIFESITIRGKHTVCKANNTIAAFIGYQMAFLKAHHPEEFSAADAGSIYATFDASLIADLNEDRVNLPIRLQGKISKPINDLNQDGDIECII